MNVEPRGEGERERVCAGVTGFAPQGLNPWPAAHHSAALKPEMNLRMVLAFTEKKMHSLSLRTAEQDRGPMLCN